MFEGYNFYIFGSYAVASLAFGMVILKVVLSRRQLKRKLVQLEQEG